MARVWRTVYAGAKYHVTSRGNGKQKIFLCADDYARFMEQLAYCLEIDEVILYAYCLISNHYHLFIETPKGNIKKFMQRLNTAYSMYFRYKHSKPGHCLQGRYGAKVVGGDQYILGLTRYIHLNPVKVDRMQKSTPVTKRKHLEGWKWSSCGGYVDEKLKQDMVDYRWLGLTGARTGKGQRRKYRDYLEGMLVSDDERFIEGLSVSRYAIGDERFVEQVETDVRSQIEGRAVYGDVREPRSEVVLAVDDIAEIIAKVYDFSIEDLKSHGKISGIAKAVFIELCCTCCGKTQRDVAGFLGYTSETTVCKQRKRLKKRLSDPAHRKSFDKALEMGRAFAKSRVKV